MEVGRDAAAATGLRRDDAIRRIATATFTPALVLRVAGISGSAAMRRSAPAALAHSVLNVGGSSATPEPGSGPSANRRVPVRPARVPRLTALAGAGPAAMAACRNPATVAA
ncbi:hypothetical protein [Dactylosporangium sp. NPDC049140]|uniref:hypothetical protein n=1 Tax=Dactylosporangium sp. NPDC049140 TaxID=3155647 RepID=UPI0033CEE6D9